MMTLVSLVPTDTISAAWYNTSWSYRVAITIDADMVDADLIDFPVYVDMSNLPSEFFDHVRSDGGDIRVMAADEVTELPREVVSIDIAAKTGELHFKAPSLSDSTDTVFYIYYGNPAASNYANSATYGARNVWTNGYIGVFHDGGGNDSTSNGFTGTANGGVVAGDGIGKMGSSTIYDGSNDYFSYAYNAAWNLPDSAGSVSAWFSTDTNPGQNSVRGIFYKRWHSNTANNDGIYLMTHQSGPSNPQYIQTILDFNNADTLKSSTDPVTLQTNYFAFATYDSSVLSLYNNGALQGTTTKTATVTFPNNEGAFIGRTGGGTARGGYMDGMIDEVRVHSVHRAAGWISTEYHNQDTPSTFYSAGAEEVLVKGLLDDIAGASFAFSISRYLSATQVGNPVVRLREDSGNNQLDFKLNNSNVLVSNDANEDTVPEWLAAHGASTAYVVSVYDQSGNGRTFSQSNTTRQPPLVLSSSLNGLAVIDFSGSSTYKLVSEASMNITSANGIEVHALTYPTNVSASRNVVFANFAVSLGYVGGNGSGWLWQADIGDQMFASTAPINNTPYQISWRYVGSNQFIIKENGAEVWNGPSATGIDWRNGLHAIGNNAPDAAANSWAGQIAEVIFYNGIYNSGDVGDIETSMQSHGGIGGGTPPDVPNTPTFSNITETTLRVEWGAVDGADSYTVERCQGAACSNWVEISSGITDLYYNDSVLSADTLYRYRLYAVNDDGESDYSGIGEVTTSSVPSGAERIFRLLPGLRLKGGVRLR